MEKISNADKQVRFRKKEQLKRRADNILRKWQLEPWKWGVTKPQDIQQLLNGIVDLPTGWTEEDYESASVKLSQLELELVSSRDQIANDVNESRADFMTTPDPAKYVKDIKNDIEKTKALASHIISALNLSNCREADQASALMEALRFVGLSLASKKDVPCSSSAAMCLASIGPQYERPKWFAEKLVNTIGWRIGKDVSKDVGQRLLNLI